MKDGLRTINPFGFFKWMTSNFISRFRACEEFHMRGIKYILPIGVFIFVLAAYIPVFAQRSMDTHKEEIELTRAAIKVHKKQIVARNMNLTPDENKKFWAVYREYQDKMESVNNRRIKLITEYADTVKNRNLTDEKSLNMLNEYLSYERMRLITKQSFVDKFKKVLPSKKVARFFQIENKLEAIVNLDIARQIPLVR